MKSAICQINSCGVLVFAERTSELMVVHPDPEEHKKLVDLAEFDLLAGKMAVHIGNYHPEHAREMSAVGFLASKVYAMTWVVSSEKGFAAMRNSWKRVFIEELAKDPDQAAAAAADSTTSPPPVPEGSYEKKSERKDSI
jgi:hypothetical protein